jgi:hypothetical protein
MKHDAEEAIHSSGRPPARLNSGGSCRMYVEDLKDRIYVDRPEDLIDRLRSVRKGRYGAFFLSHDDSGPSLSIHINGGVAYVHFFPDNLGRHPGFQPVGMSPIDCEESVHFLQTDGGEADSLTMPKQTLVSLEVAYRAATEFLNSPVLPASIRWLEL